MVKIGAVIVTLIGVLVLIVVAGVTGLLFGQPHGLIEPSTCRRR